MTILLKNGKLVDYKTNTNDYFDIFIENGIIKEITKEINTVADSVIDCTNLFIIPGMIDIHCHLREPGFEYKETIETGMKSAVKGGFTSICPMPNTKPTCDSAFILQKIQEEAKKVGICNVFPYASVTVGEKGEELTDFETLKNAGAIAFSDDGMPVVSAKIMREALIKANKLDTFVASHCEEKELGKGAINAGEIAKKLKVEGVLPEAETLMAAREVELAEINNIHAHVCHISAKETAKLIRDAKKRGVNVTCETCPHYYSFTEEEVLNSGVNAKMNPPLRKKDDMEEIIKAIQDGTIDCIITDHAPHAKEEKSQGLEKAPNGIIGFETALSATITYLIDKGYISYLDMVKLTSYNPAKILGIDRGTIEKGKTADITIFDPNKEYIYTEEMIVSKSKNTPYIGKKLKGEVKYTIVKGKIVYKNN